MARGVVDELELLGAEPLSDQRRVALPESWLVDVEAVGTTRPWTMFSPNPQVEVTKTTSGNPDSVSRVKITPEEARSERTIFCTPTERAT